MGQLTYSPPTLASWHMVRSCLHQNNEWGLLIDAEWQVLAAHSSLWIWPQQKPTGWTLPPSLSFLGDKTRPRATQLEGGKARACNQSSYLQDLDTHGPPGLLRYKNNSDIPETIARKILIDELEYKYKTSTGRKEQKLKLTVAQTAHDKFHYNFNTT